MCKKSKQKKIVKKRVKNTVAKKVKVMTGSKKMASKKAATKKAPAKKVVKKAVVKKAVAKKTEKNGPVKKAALKKAAKRSVKKQDYSSNEISSDKMVSRVQISNFPKSQTTASGNRKPAAMASSIDASANEKRSKVPIPIDATCINNNEDKTKKSLDLLVLTDRYPPSALGGAELSLHNVLKQLPKKCEVLVMSLFSKEKKMRFYYIDNVLVLSIPEPLEAPFHSLDPSFAKVIRSLPILGKLIKKILSSYQKRLIHKYDNYEDFFYSNLYSIKKVKKIINKFNISKIHADNYRSILTTDKLDLPESIIKFCTVRDSRFIDIELLENKTDGALLEFKNTILSKFHTVTAASQYIKKAYNDKFDNLNIKVIKNSIDELKTDYNHIGELPNFNILIIGMLTENKGQLDFIKKLHRQIKENPAMNIHLVGRGPRIQKRIQYFCDLYQITDHVHFYGYLPRDGIYKMIKKCQVVALPTYVNEAFGRVPLEAALMKKPVVAFKSGGLVESINDGETGFLVNKGDFKAMYEKILLFKNNPILRQSIGDNAYYHVKKEFCAKRIGNEFSEVWFT